MLRVEPSDDVAYADEVLRRPDIFARVRDDSTPAAEHFSFTGVPGVLLRAFNGDEPLGFFFLVEKIPGVFEVHTALTVTGSKALSLGRLGIEWVFNHLDCVALTSVCRSNNRAAHVFAALNGFRDGVTMPSVLIDGEVVTQISVSLSRADWMKAHGLELTPA